jgi:hypothetical protein
LNVGADFFLSFLIAVYNSFFFLMPGSDQPQPPPIVMGALVPGEGIKWELERFARMTGFKSSFQLLIVFLDRLHTYYG